ncbi:MAG: hypothetical protein LQ351_002021 [Letrouitia transgressa]|nr:MAG: hypothetical protein LQ351_002021 [Letrouitia transgressa]
MLHFFILSSLAALAAAHFTLDYPPARGFDEEQLTQFPCGGQDEVSTSRTPWPLKGGHIQLTMEHDRVAAQVLIGLGNDVGDAFNTVLVPTIQQEGFGKFCFGDVVIPASLGVKDGQNATIQCADITFTSSETPNSECTNGTGVTAAPFTGQSRNANGSDSTATASGAPSPAGSGSTSSPTGAARKLGTAALSVGIGAAVAIIGGW